MDIWLWLLAFAVAYFLPPALLRLSAARLWLESLERPLGSAGVRQLLWSSWAWSCLGAPLAHILLTTLNSAVFPFVRLPLWAVIAIQVAHYFLLCLGFDVWRAKRLLQPRDGVERKRVALWVGVSNLLGAAWTSGLCVVIIWWLTQALRYAYL